MHFRMDWAHLKFDWNHARAFLATAEEGSLSAAARALGLAQPTLGRQIAALEESLGVVLFERTGRGLDLTPSGTRLLEHVRPMAEAATAFSLSATGQAQAIGGTITITASEIYSAYLLPSILAELRAAEPGIEIVVLASNSVANLRQREADIAVRNARPSDEALIARLIGEDEGRFYASRGYLDSLGPINERSDLNTAHFIGFDDNAPMRDSLNRRGFEVTDANFPVRTGNHIVQVSLTREGLGIGIFPTDVGDSDPALCHVFPDEEPIRFPIWLTAHRELQTSARVRLVFDFLADALTRKLAKNQT